MSNGVDARHAATDDNAERRRRRWCLQAARSGVPIGLSAHRARASDERMRARQQCRCSPLSAEPICPGVCAIPMLAAPGLDSLPANHVIGIDLWQTTSSRQVSICLEIVRPERRRISRTAGHKRYSQPLVAKSLADWRPRHWLGQGPSSQVLFAVASPDLSYL